MLSGRVLYNSQPLEVVWEDEHCFCVNKPALVHSVSQAKSPSLLSVASALQLTEPRLVDVAENPGEGGLVQRLDFETSGLLLGAKTKACWLALREQFRSHAVQKKYIALVEGHLPKQRVIDAPIGSPYRRGTKVRVYLPNRPTRGIARAQNAHSQFTPVRHCSRGTWTIVEVLTSTGRRHQVRAHASALGFPLVGDVLYSAKTFVSCDECGAIPPFFLHAASLELLHPITGKALSLSAPAPNYLKKEDFTLSYRSRTKES